MIKGCNAINMQESCFVEQVEFDMFILVLVESFLLKFIPNGAHVMANVM
jgi:hypothetical protein